MDIAVFDLSNADNIAESARAFVWQSLFDGLGVIMQEDIAPGSASLRELIGATLLLTRADPAPHRIEITQELLRLFPRRRDDIQETINKYVGEPMLDITAYEPATALLWSGFHAGIPDMEPRLGNVITKGWELANRTHVHSIGAKFCFVLTAASGDPSDIQKRDYWAFKAFEPIAAVGAKVAIQIGLIEDNEP